MRRGAVLLVAGVMGVAWLLGTPASAEVRQTGTGTSTEVADGQGTVRTDPASTRLRQVTYGLVGLGAVLIVGTAVFWRATRPPLLTDGGGVSAGAGGGRAKRGSRPSAATPEAAPGAAAAGTAGAAATGGKISAAAFLATPPGSSASAALGGAPLAGAVVSTGAAAGAGAAAAAASLADLAPPVGGPAIDAPAPLVDIPLGSPPLVGNDSAWIIESDRAGGLIPTTPTAGDFPPPSDGLSLDDLAALSAADVTVPIDDPAPAEEPAEPAIIVEGPAVIDVTATDRSEQPRPKEQPAPSEAPADPVPAAPEAVSPLFAALSALPDQEPAPVRFDDPPVERVVRRRPLAGAPGFDRIARETATNATVDVRRPDAGDAVPEAEPPATREPAPEAPRRRRPDQPVDDMALVASALSRLPRHEVEPDPVPVVDDVEVPPVGVFYDQDLDPGDPPGRP